MRILAGIAWWSLGLCAPVWLTAQQRLTLRLLPTDTTAQALARIATWRPVHPDSASAAAEVRRVLQQAHEAGYLEASADTLLRADSAALTALVHLGPRFYWRAWLSGNVPTEVLKAAKIRPIQWEGKPVQWPQVQSMQQRLLQHYEQQGFAFAKIQLQTSFAEAHYMDAAWRVEPGPLIRMGKLNVEGRLKISPYFLKQYLGIRPGQPFKQSQVLRIPQRLRELPFAEVKADPLLIFQPDSSADLTLFLEPRKAGRFDFLIGVLPNSAQVGRMLITGTLLADFYNQLGKGERLMLSFERLRPETQQIQLQLNYPYILQLPFSLDGRFHLYKRDTTFLNLEYHLGAGYQAENATLWKAFAQQRSSRLLGFNERLLLQTRKLPADQDVTFTAFGMELGSQRLDYRLNPRRGWSGVLRAAAGTRLIRPNSRITALGLAELYDSLILRSAQYRLEFQGQYFVPLFRAATWRLAAQGGYLISAQAPFRNEQYRIGGNRLLRGFDEEFFFVSEYTVSTAEFRLLIGPNTYLYTFLDAGLLRDRHSQVDRRFGAYGFGTGITLETRAGLLGLSVALGAYSDVPLDWSAPKVHIGYVGLF